MNNSKLFRILRILVLAGVLIIEGLAIVLVGQLQMFPAEYMVLLAAFLLALWVILAALMFVPGRKKKKAPGVGRSIAIVVLVLCVLLGCGIASKMVIELKNTLNDISSPTELTAYVDVFIRTDDPAKTVADTAGYTYAITEYYDVENTRRAIEKLEAMLGQKLTTVTLPSVQAMADALYSGQADAMLINTAYISLLAESEEYADFETKTRLLVQLDIRYTVESGKNPGTADPGQQDPSQIEGTGVKIPEGDLTKTPFVVYLAGSDSRSGVLDVSTRNDVNILAVVNPTTRQILLINTPRDFYIPNPAGNGALDKLTHCGIATVENSALALSQFYQVPIRYYAHICFEGLKGLVDAVDGVTIYSDVAYQAGNTWIEKGKNHLNGEQALAYARERKNVAGGDNARGSSQMKIIKAVINKMISGKLITKYTDILGSIRGLFRTNMPSEEMANLVQMQLSDMRDWNIISYAVTGESDNQETYSWPGRKLFVYIPNMDTVEYARELMQRVVDGEILDQSDIIPAK